MHLKKDFPLFQNNPGLIYLDSAATLQKPRYVIEGVKHYLEYDYANIHRGRYSLSERSEELFWQARKKVAGFINASDESEVIFTANATDSANKLVQSLCLSGVLGKGDKVLISSAEHHANIVPWQMGAERYAYDIEFFAIKHDGQIDQKDFQQKYDKRTKVIALSIVSNVMGSIVNLDSQYFPLLDLLSSTDKDNKQNAQALLVIDASQAVPHIKVDVKKLGADFAFFTGHKLGACTGIGVLRGKKEHLKKMTPSIGGGGAIESVSKTGYTLQDIPDKFEPGTPNLTGVISLKLAIEYLEKSGAYSIKSGEKELSLGAVSRFYTLLHEIEKPLILYCLEQFKELEKYGVKLLGSKNPEEKIGLFSFSLPVGKFSTQLGQYMANQNICIRCGGHCAHPLHETLGLEHGTCRISFWGYNSLEDINKFFDFLKMYVFHETTVYSS